MRPPKNVEDLTGTETNDGRGPRPDIAEALYRKALEIDSTQINALQLLGTLALNTGRAKEAVPMLKAVVEKIERGPSQPEYSKIYNNLGLALAVTGQNQEAITYYQQALLLAPEDPEVHVNLAEAQAAQGKVAEAVRCLEFSVAKQPRAAWFCRLGKLHESLSSIERAEQSYRAALELDPKMESAIYNLALLVFIHNERPDQTVELLKPLRNHCTIRSNVELALADANFCLDRFNQAIDHYRSYLQLVPADWKIHLQLGSTLAEAARYSDAIASIKEAMDIQDADVMRCHIELGNVLLRAGQLAQAQEEFRCSRAIGSFATQKTSSGHAVFSALFLSAPGSANTPSTYLIDGKNYDAHFLSFDPGAIYDFSELRKSVDVVMNLISDADDSPHLLSAAAQFVNELHRPTLNHPANILKTDRATTAEIFATHHDCRVADIRRYRGTSLLGRSMPDDVIARKLPFLARVAGFHNGDEFEMINDIRELVDFVSRRPEALYYIMDYIDYRSPDGFFRKYRFFYVDGVLYPYHLAIGTHWKVHHIRTEMHKHSWMQEEEAAFLKQPDSVFGNERQRILQKIADTIGLEFMGIDCGIDLDGRVVLFESNATMHLKGNNHNFPYKTVYVRRIREAFNATLERMAKAY